MSGIKKQTEGDKEHTSDGLDRLTRKEKDTSLQCCISVELKQKIQAHDDDSTCVRNNSTYPDRFRFPIECKDLVGIFVHTAKFLRHQLTLPSVVQTPNGNGDDH